MIMRNSNNEQINAFVAYARPSSVVNESVSKLLTGEWFVQQIGEPAERVAIELICTWDSVQEIRGYAESKAQLTVELIGSSKSGIIIGAPSYQLVRPNRTNPTYSMTFELAVIPNV